MQLSPEEQAQRIRYEGLYKRSLLPVMASIERSVCGCDYGGTSWTTREEAHEFSALLGLRPGLRLLDIGAGSGWPGLYMAGISGCDVTLIDLPQSALRIAAERAVNDRLPGTCWVAVADAANLPFRDGSFDAISHSDVLCCLREKRAVLAACRRVVRRGGSMVFSVISVAPDLTHDDHRRAVENGPEFIEAEADYATLLRQTGWTVLDCRDTTNDYMAACRRQLRADEDLKETLQSAIGASEFTERRVGWQSKLEALRHGLLRREIFVAAATRVLRLPASTAIQHAVR